MAAEVGARSRGLLSMPTSRTEAFSDGVFAIAITILVLEIHVPSATDVAEAGGLLLALLRGWPAYLSYLATFLTIGNIWLSHHAVFEKLRSVDRGTQWLNLVLLMMVSFIPFPNAVVADYLADGAFSTDAKTAVGLYSLVAIACVVPWSLLWRHVQHHPELLVPGYGAAYAAGESRRPLIGAVAYAICFLAGLVLPIAAVVLFIAVAIFFAVTVDSRRPPASAHASIRIPRSREQTAEEVPEVRAPHGAEGGVGRC